MIGGGSHQLLFTRSVAATVPVEIPRRLVLSNGGFDVVTDTLEEALADIRANETLSRSTDFPN